MHTLWEIEQRLWNQGMHQIAGVDEVGRGALAGPVVACAVVLPANFSVVGISDSKKLTKEHREKLFPLICQHVPKRGIGIVNHVIIDEINILQATYQAMLIALRQLSTTPDWVLIDGRDFPNIPFSGEAVVKGDSKSISIATASIIAKVTRDQLMDYFGHLYPQYGFERHKGYCTANHVEAIQKYGPCPIHRRSFAPIKHHFSSPQLTIFQN